MALLVGIDTHQAASVNNIQITQQTPNDIITEKDSPNYLTGKYGYILLICLFSNAFYRVCYIVFIFYFSIFLSLFFRIKINYFFFLHYLR